MDKLLYHYCSTSTFQAIVENGSIRLSSMSLSNDTMEGKWALEQFGNICDEKGLHPEIKEMLFAHLNRMPISVDGLAFCLSAHGDMLSQWRGYADDGFGISIGFSKEQLTALLKTNKVGDGKPLLVPVVYDCGQTRAYLEKEFHKVDAKIKAISEFAIGQAIKELPKAAADLHYSKVERAWREAVTTATRLMGTLYTFKNPAFSEEAEWRVLAHIIPERGDKFQMQACRGVLKPFLTCFLQNDENSVVVIEEVILGPKHTTPETIIRAFLAQNGFENVKVSRSNATYR